MRMMLVVAEKPSVARAIREVVKGVRVTAVRGHVLDIDLPDGFEEWRLDNIVDILEVRKFKTVIRDQDAFNRLKEELKGCSTLIIATDNDHEGELIGYEILKIHRALNGDKPFYRMRFNSVEKDELLRAWRNLEPDLNWGWVYKAEFRRVFDLLTGAAFTRLLTLSARRLGYKGLISWGSCQTPTLYFVVKREWERKEFKPEFFWKIDAKLSSSLGEEFSAESDKISNKSDGEKALKAIHEAKFGHVEKYSEEKEVIQRPLPLRTDDALRDLTKITGLSASKVLNVLEDLYAEGYISYPRTDTNKYPANFNFDKYLRAAVEGGVTAGVSLRSYPNPRQGRHDDKAHPPIHPIRPYMGTGVRRVVWEYVARRYVANAYMDDALALRREAIVNIAGVKLYARGFTVTLKGFLRIYPYEKIEERPLPRLSEGSRVMVLSAKLKKGRTSPPPRLTESELLALMESNGIGTDATRAIYPSLIIERGYAVKPGRMFKPTPLGEALIKTLGDIDKRLITPETRRYVEEVMGKVEAGGDMWRELEESLRVYKVLLKECIEKGYDIAKALVEKASL